MRADRVLVQEKAQFAKVQAPCPYFGTCGGCTVQDLAYEDQVALKQQRLLRLLGQLDPSLSIEVVGMEDPWRYRNKAELTFGELQGQMVLGYHAARSFWRIVDVEDCLLLPEPMSRLVNRARAFARQHGLSAYNPRSHQGFLRYLVIRMSHATQQILVCVVTTQGERTLLERLADELIASDAHVVSVYWGLSTKVADVAIPEELFLLRGEPYLEDRVGPFRLQLHPLNFLQPTPLQAERMYQRLGEWASHAPSGIAWDLYCGIGLVAFYLASKFRTIYGIDSDARNLQMAQLNATANAIGNVEFHLGRAEEALANKRFWLQEAKPDLVVVDPPRSGLHARVIAAVLAARPKQLLYVSCNAQALLHDLRQLTSSFPRYRLRQAVAFDLFPHTNHLEVLTLLERS